MKAEPYTIREIERLVEEWKRQVYHSTLADNTKHTYTSHVEHFERWYKDNFPIRGIEQK